LGQPDSANRKIELLQELATWTRLNTILTHKKAILETFEFSKELLIFQLSKGKSSRELAKEFHMNKKTVTNLWKRWIEKGLAQAISV